MSTGRVLKSIFQHPVERLRRGERLGSGAQRRLSTLHKATLPLCSLWSGQRAPFGHRGCGDSNTQSRTRSFGASTFGVAPENNWGDTSLVRQTQCCARATPKRHRETVGNSQHCCDMSHVSRLQWCKTVAPIVVHWASVLTRYGIAACRVRFTCLTLRVWGHGLFGSA
jgi:hypothetical protein